MRTPRHDNGGHRRQQTPQHTSRHTRNLSAGLLGSNRAKEQRLRAEPSWCHSPISGDPRLVRIAAAVSSTSCLARRFALSSTRDRRKRSQYRPMSHFASAVGSGLHLASAVELWLHIASAVELWLMGPWAFRLRQCTRRSSPAAAPDAVKANSHLMRKFVVSGGRRRAPSKELRRPCRSFSEP